MYYLEKKDINEAIKFLEESTADNEKLLNLYRSSNNYKKAYDLANKLYKESSNIDYLAQIAMIEFEMTENKKDVLASVIKKFEDVLVVLDNHVYQNYLGYILIDFDIDVKKGLALVKKALEKAPHNLAYIDSLAWGQYKLKDCKKAYDNMKKVVDSAGLDDKEIKLHWEKIKECSK
jgi:tetratricopeptide (TPR) repeat protein